MNPLFESVASYLTEKGWPSNQTEDSAYLWTYVCTKSGRWPFSAFMDVVHGMIEFDSTCPLRVPVDRRNKAAEFLMRVNRWTFVGGFVLDFDLGVVRYITQMPIPGESGPPDFEEEVNAAVRRLVEKNLAMMDRYLPGIARVLSSDTTPAEAHAEIETGMPVDRRYLYN